MCKCFSGSRSCPETPTSLKRLEGFLDAEEHKIRFESWGFLGYDSSFAFFSGKSTMVDFRVGLLKLQWWEMHRYFTAYTPYKKTDIVLDFKFTFLLDLNLIKIQEKCHDTSIQYHSHTTQINIFWLRSANKGTHYLLCDRLKVMFDSMSGTKPLFIYFISVRLASVKVIYRALTSIQKL